jgi:hypothetical protein
MAITGIDPKFDREAFKRAISMIESSGGKYLEASRLNNGELASSAAGKYHFLYQAIKDDPDMRGVSKREFINNDALQEKIMDKALDGNLKGYPNYIQYAKDLKASSKSNLRLDEIASLTHFLGQSGVKKHLTSGYTVPGAEHNSTADEYLTKYNEFSNQTMTQGQPRTAQKTQARQIEKPVGEFDNFELPSEKANRRLDNTSVQSSRQFIESIPRQSDSTEMKRGSGLENMMPQSSSGRTILNTIDYAMGGRINNDTNSTEERLVRFESGGTHEENPLGGIPQGMASNGKMNSVEEGETKFGDYVFSNRLGEGGMLGTGSTKSNSYAEGGEIETSCGGPGQPPCNKVQSESTSVNKKRFNEKELKNIIADDNELVNNYKIKNPRAEANKIENFLPDKQTVDFFNKLKTDVGEEYYRKALEIQVSRGNPSVDVGTDKGLPFHSRRNYNPFTNEVNIPKGGELGSEHELESYMSEISHAGQPLLKTMGKFVANDIPAYVKSYFSKGDTEDNIEKHVYNSKNTVEGYTHNVVEPALRKQLEDYSAMSYQGFDYEKPARSKNVINTTPTPKQNKYGGALNTNAEGGEMNSEEYNAMTDSLNSDTGPIDPKKANIDPKKTGASITNPYGMPVYKQPTMIEKMAGLGGSNYPLETMKSIYRNAEFGQKTYIDDERSKYLDKKTGKVNFQSLIKDPGAQAFLDRYNDPITRQRLKDQAGLNDYDIDNKIIAGLKASKTIGGNDPGTKANYDHVDKKIFMGEDYKNNKAVETHERVHASNFEDKNSSNLLDILGNSFDSSKTFLKRRSPETLRYMNYPHEAYGNFTEFRENIGLKPGEQINKKELEKRVKAKGLELDNFYQSFDDDKIIQALNTIADTKSQPKKQTFEDYRLS